MMSIAYLDGQMSIKMEEMLLIASLELSDEHRLKEFNRILSETRSIIDSTPFDADQKDAIKGLLDSEPERNYDGVEISRPFFSPPL